MIKMSKARLLSLPQPVVVVGLLVITGGFAQGKPRSGRSSTGLEEIIDLEETVCRPRFDCSSRRAGSTEGSFDQTQAFTDGINQGADLAVSFSDLSDLPKEVLDGSAPSGPIFAPIITEEDENRNNFIREMKENCTRDQLDYCVGQDWQHPEHTMCKFCGLGSQCPYYLDPTRNDVTGRAIKDQPTIDYILKLHNEIRSKIARGWCDQPKAGCMGPLQWDDELARVAQKWSDQCANVDYLGDTIRKDPQLFHDLHANRKIDRFSDWQGAGQNVARDIARGKPGEFDAHKLIGHWFNQILFFDPQGVLAFGSGQQCSAGIGYYTQLVWQDTTHVGCGWTQFQYRGFKDYFENFLVCNYGPSGNIWDLPVYDVANETCNCPCIGCDPETGLCPANCNYAVWSSWEPWSTCSQTCGRGRRERERLCQESRLPPRSSPAAKRLIGVHGSLDLVPVAGDEEEKFDLRVLGQELDPKQCKRGDPSQTDVCNTHVCPEWTDWGDWGDCSLTCGGGVQRRNRNCELPELRTSTTSTSLCAGESEETRACNEQECPEPSPWSDWSECSVTCGGGSRSRERECNEVSFRGASDDGEYHDDNPCQVPLTQEAVCNEEACPQFSDWSTWTDCSRTCGGGSQERTRECVATLGRLFCEGESREQRICNDNVCPEWSPWQEWSQCSVSCGGGSRERVRECKLPGGRRNGGEELFCPGEATDQDQCNPEACPELSPWAAWTECSVTCGGGDRFRTRECISVSDVSFELSADASDNPCKQPLLEEDSCNDQLCPELSPWSEWGECTLTCGGGQKRRTRECNDIARDIVDNLCKQPLEELTACNEQQCPELTEWSEWSQCSHTCGGGFRQKNRQCIDPNIAREGNTDNPCKALLEVIEECNKNDCPEWSPWSEWTQCSKTCGGGQHRRFRQCTDPITNEESFCSGDGEETESCNEEDCPYWTEWSEWTACSKTCGSGGSKTRVRQCKLLDEDSAGCEGPDTSSEPCNEDKTCPEWSPWTEWGQCTATCGGGIEKRIRDCLLPRTRNGNGTNLHGCDGETWEMRPCNEQGCPTWTEWTSWTECSRSCGGGRRVRLRECKLPEDLPRQVLALFCPGDEKIIEACNTERCPTVDEWSEWGQCSKSCGGGTRTRVRECVGFRDPDGNRCNTDLEETEACNEQNCPVWTEWTEWTSCTQTCGGGTRRKVRECVLNERNLCLGDAEVIEDCNEEDCPTVTPWGEWTECTKTCGGGERRRVRDCVIQRSGVGNACQVPLEEVESCAEDKCRDWTPWSPWTGCSAECGGGTRTKVRDCVETYERLQQCEGDDRTSEDCNQQPCPQWTDWSNWSECSTTCGGGKRQRGRECANPVERFGRLLCDQGEDFEEEDCNDQKCPAPEWTEWSPWSACSSTCGGGSTVRSRQCVQPGESEPSPSTECDGPPTMMLFCNLGECESNSEWSPWGEWSECSATCGGGNRRRSRTCVQEQENYVSSFRFDIRLGLITSPCQGNPQQTETCSPEECPLAP